MNEHVGRSRSHEDEHAANERAPRSRAVVRYAARFVAAMLRRVPRRRRFAVLMLMARTVRPLMRFAGASDVREAWKVDTTAEIALLLVVHVMEKNRIPFDPVVEVENYGALREALAAGRGALVLAPHTTLLALLFRRFHDDGLAPVGLSSLETTLAGTAIPAHTLQPSTTFLLSVRSLLRSGRLICGMPDRPSHVPGRTIEFETLNGRVIFAPALLEIALHAGARVFFTEVHVAGSRVLATIKAPSSPAADGLAHEFIDFVRLHVASRHPSGRRRE